MTTGHVFIATSVDGFIARKDHALDWLPQENTEGEDSGYETFIGSVDGLIMGRHSFENILTFGHWPYSKPVVVLSQTLTQADVPADLEGRVRISQLSPEEIMEFLDEEGWRRAYVDGGLLVQSFIKAGLIEDMVVTAIPVLIGDGRPLFGEIDADVDLELIDSRAFSSGMVQNHYRMLKARTRCRDDKGVAGQRCHSRL